VVWLILVQWLHVLCGIMWFGGTLYIDLVLIPAFQSAPLPLQREVSTRVSPLTNRVLRPTAIAVIVLGVVRGTILGRLHSVQDVLGTAYGATWLAALIVTLALFTFGEAILEPALRHLNTAKEAGAYAAALRRVQVLAAVELVGFFAIFTCMILMRFGL
jgi:uncharacterized membrane protein